MLIKMKIKALVSFVVLVLIFSFPTKARRLLAKPSSNLVHVDQNEYKGLTLFKRVRFGMLAKIPILPPYNLVHFENENKGLTHINKVRFGMLGKIPILPPSNLVHIVKSINFGMLPKNVHTPSELSPTHNPGDPLLTQLPTIHPTLKAESVKLGPNFESINFGMFPKNVPAPFGPSPIHNLGDPPSTSLRTVHPHTKVREV